MCRMAYCGNESGIHSTGSISYENGRWIDSSDTARCPIPNTEQHDTDSFASFHWVPETNFAHEPGPPVGASSEYVLSDKVMLQRSVHFGFYDCKKYSDEWKDATIHYVIPDLKNPGGLSFFSSPLASFPAAGWVYTMPAILRVRCEGVIWCILYLIL